MEWAWLKAGRLLSAEEMVTVTADTAMTTFSVFTSTPSPWRELLLALDSAFPSLAAGTSLCLRTFVCRITAPGLDPSSASQ